MAPQSSVTSRHQVLPRGGRPEGAATGFRREVSIGSRPSYGETTLLNHTVFWIARRGRELSAAFWKVLWVSGLNSRLRLAADPGQYVETELWTPMRGWRPPGWPL